MKFSYPQKVLFKHCDPAGIVFYPRYFEMMNDCVEGFFAEIGAPFEGFIPPGGVPTVQMSADFLAPSRHGDLLSVDLEIMQIGRTSMGLSHVAVCNNERRFTATSTLVNIDGNGRPDPWPDAIRTAIIPYLRSE
ncbi:acyl-CoA thioesterase [Jannaschia sp. CCS1]|uniref:acyl-CoA thioesterase n=1 Tax=Jannaschia sp. (strain CCS1) TaxID=290400 RepID=UPI000053A6D6|nr:thioesterase family protein [Jannaschia sp. CCS1]ABD54246.1 thioesterase superfamily [Jannaschia sp. CCS1]